ncbi:hypothetical protein KOW79_021469 [Hemibagrus wyckioides]|uniref:Uncharacterized protein n=1 Tax=Hemibagrus wyckioides TaxID=337641 RepID=A0A9D3S8M8_9TELE|nr:hypothetical protein KOW79_021469 [Hemibagrus wyckioides]
MSSIIPTSPSPVNHSLGLSTVTSGTHVTDRTSPVNHSLGLSTVTSGTHVTDRSSSDATYDVLPVVLLSGLLALFVLLILLVLILWPICKRGRYYTHEPNETEGPKVHELSDSSDEDL